ncbi:MAG: hypothetical protein ACYC49_06190 [Ignavibacteriaceae bacterium]
MKRNEIYHKKYLDIKNKDLKVNTIVRQACLPAGRNGIWNMENHFKYLDIKNNPPLRINGNTIIP